MVYLKIYPSVSTQNIKLNAVNVFLWNIQLCITRGVAFRLINVDIIIERITLFN